MKQYLLMCVLVLAGSMAAAFQLDPPERLAGGSVKHVLRYREKPAVTAPAKVEIEGAQPVYIPLGIYYVNGGFDHAAILMAVTPDLQQCLQELTAAIDGITKTGHFPAGKTLLGDCVAVPYDEPKP